MERADQGRVRLHRGPDRQLEHARRGDRRIRAGRAGLDRRQAGDRAAGDRGAQPPRRRAGRRPAGRRRGPAGRHQEPRDLRGARRDGADHRAYRAGARHAGARAGPVQAADRPALGRAGLRRPVVLAAEEGAGSVRRRNPGARVRRDPDGAARRAHRRQRTPQRGVAVRLQPGHLRRGRHLRPVVGEGLRACARPVVEDRRATGPGTLPHLREVRVAGDSADPSARSRGQREHNEGPCGAAGSPTARRTRWRH